MTYIDIFSILLLLPGLQTKNFFYMMILNFLKELKFYFQNKKWNHLSRNGIFFAYFQASDQKTSFTKGAQNWFLNRKWNHLSGKEFFFTYFQASDQKTSFTKGTQNWFSNRKWNYFPHFQASDEKTSFTTYFSFDPKVSKLIFKTGNGIIQTGNGIIIPTSRPLIKKLI